MYYYKCSWGPQLACAVLLPARFRCRHIISASAENAVLARCHSSCMLSLVMVRSHWCLVCINKMSLLCLLPSVWEKCVPLLRVTCCTHLPCCSGTQRWEKAATDCNAVDPVQHPFVAGPDFIQDRNREPPCLYPFSIMIDSQLSLTFPHRHTAWYNTILNKRISWARDHTPAQWEYIYEHALPGSPR